MSALTRSSLDTRCLDGKIGHSELRLVDLEVWALIAHGDLVVDIGRHDSVGHTELEFLRDGFPGIRQHQAVQ